MARKFEDYNFLVAEDGFYTLKNVTLGGSATLDMSASTGTFKSPTGGSVFSGSQVITSGSANALAAGANGATNPAFNVDASTTSVATGLNVKGAAAASGVALAALSSGSNESLTLDAKGTGTVGINTVGTTSGLVTIGNPTSLAGAAVNGPATVTSASTLALAVGANGSTTPALQVDASSASSVNGLKIKSSASGSGAALSVVSSATNDPLVVDAKGSGVIAIGSNSTGILVFGRGPNKVPILGTTLTSLATQNTTPTAAQLLGGYIEHASVTGGGTATLDTASNIIGAINNAASGDSFSCLYANTGTQTVTITTNTGLTLKGTVAIPTGKNALLNFRLTGGGNVTVYCTVSG